MVLSSKVEITSNKSDPDKQLWSLQTTVIPANHCDFCKDWRSLKQCGHFKQGWTAQIMVIHANNLSTLSYIAFAEGKTKHEPMHYGLVIALPNLPGNTARGLIKWYSNHVKFDHVMSDNATPNHLAWWIESIQTVDTTTIHKYLILVEQECDDFKEPLEYLNNHRETRFKNIYQSGRFICWLLSKQDFSCHHNANCPVSKKTRGKNKYHNHN